MISFEVAVGILVFSGAHTLGFFSMVVENLIGTFAGLINDEGFHGGSVDKTFRTFALVTLVADVIVVTVVAAVVLALVREVVAKRSVARCLELLFGVWLFRLVRFRVRWLFVWY